MSLGNLGSTGVTVLNNASTAGEDDKSGLVALQAVHVQGEGLLALVGSSVVNRDSNGLGKLSVDTGGLQLLQSETSAKLDLGVVL